jgi:hypothetical protein
MIATLENNMLLVSVRTKIDQGSTLFTMTIVTISNHLVIALDGLESPVLPTLIFRKLTFSADQMVLVAGAGFKFNSQRAKFFGGKPQNWMTQT